MKSFAMGLALVLTGLASPAAAKVAEVSEQGFVVRHLAVLPKTVDETWRVLVTPSKWWDSDHTWSGDAAHLSLEEKAGGCFCEILPNPDSPKAAPRGSVEHMRVVYIERPRVLRMTGALGPLQSDALNGTLTIQLKASEDGEETQVLLEYVVGGYSRAPFATLAPGVDAMLGAQILSLTNALGGAFAKAFGATGSLPAAQPPKEERGEGGQGMPTLNGVLPLADEPPSLDADAEEDEKLLGR